MDEPDNTFIMETDVEPKAVHLGASIRISCMMDDDVNLDGLAIQVGKNNNR